MMDLFENASNENSWNISKSYTKCNLKLNDADKNEFKEKQD